MKKLSILLPVLFALLLTGTATASAAIEKHVRWSSEIEKVSDTQGILRVNVDVDEGWHIYGLEMPDYDDASGVPDPTHLVVDNAPGVTFDLPESSVAPIEHFDQFMNLNLPWLVGKFTISWPFTLAEGSTGARIQGYVRFMACNRRPIGQSAHKPIFTAATGRHDVIAHFGRRDYGFVVHGRYGCQIFGAFSFVFVA